MLEAFANQQTDLTRALVISRTFDWTFLLKKVSSEHSLRLLYVLISYRNNSQRRTSLYRSIYCYKRIPAQYDDTGQKQLAIIG